MRKDKGGVRGVHGATASEESVLSYGRWERVMLE